MVKNLPIREGVNDSIELMISILLRYPEIITVKTDPKTKEIIFSFLVKKKFTQGEFFAIQKRLLSNLETFLFLQNKESSSIEIQLISYEDYTLVEIVRDFQSISQREISLIIQLIQNEFDTYLLTEYSHDHDIDDTEFQDEMIENLLDQLQFQNHEDLIGFREADKVMVFHKTGV
ncbi:MAG: hypothetical protein KAX49_02145 [Halanaerobiales bacterium]|nr:hypothetical protein [Halanaerobiales bacterium]